MRRYEVDTKALIDSYTNNVAKRLPRKMRNEVGLELRALLTDELQAAADKAGRSPDWEMTVDVLKKIGRPEEVASRYGTPRGFNVIEPEHAPSFIKLAGFGVAIQWGLTLPSVFSGSVPFGKWWLGWGLGALWWVGFLVVWYGLAGWIQRRSPVDPHSFIRPWTHFIFWVPVAQDWQPLLKEPEQTLYGGARILIPLSALLTIFFVSPASFLDFCVPAGVDTSWALYDDGFRTWFLIPLVGLMAVRLVLFTAATVKENLRSRTEPIRFGLWVVFTGLLIWALLGWKIFSSVPADVLFKLWLSIFVLVNCLQIFGGIRRTLTRIRVPNDLAKRQNDRSS